MADTPIRELITLIRIKADRAGAEGNVRAIEEVVKRHAKTLKNIRKRLADYEITQAKKAARGEVDEAVRALRKKLRARLKQLRDAKKIADAELRVLKASVDKEIKEAQRRFDADLKLRRKALRAAEKAAEKVARAAEKSADKQIRQAKRVADEAVRQARRQEREFRRLSLYFGAGLGLFAARGLRRLGRGAFRGAREVIQETANEADVALIDAQRMAITARQGQQLRFASDIAGTKWEEVKTFMRRFADNLQDFKRGKGQSVDVINMLGLAGATMRGELDDPMVALIRLQREMQRFAPGIQSNILAQTGGRGGGKIAPLLAPGVGGVSDFTVLMKQAEDLGLIVSDKLIVAAQAWNDEWIKSVGLERSLRISLAEVILPVVTRLLKAFREWFTLNRGQFLDALRSVERVFLGMVAQVSKLAERADKTVRMFGGWDVALKGALVTATALAAVLGTVVTLLTAAGVVGVAGKVGTFLRGLGLSVALGAGSGTAGAGAAVLGVMALKALLVIGLIAAAVAALLLVADDFLTFLRGGDSVLGSLMEWALSLTLSKEEAKETVTETQRALREVTGFVANFTRLALAGWTLILNDLRNGLESLINWVGGLVGFDLDFNLGGAAGAVADYVAGSRIQAGKFAAAAGGLGRAGEGAFTDARSTTVNIQSLDPDKTAGFLSANIAARQASAASRANR